MLLPSPLLLHLTSSFVISTLRLTVEPENYEEFRRTDALVTPFILISPNRNISFSLRGASFLADELPLLTVPPDEPSPKQFIISARCEHGFALRVHVGEAEKTFPSPSFCANHGMNEIIIGPDDRQTELFYGCVRNVSLGGSRILDSWCRLRSTSELMEQPIMLAPQADVSLSWRPASPVSRRHRKLTDSSGTLSEKRIQPVYVGETVSVLENDSTKIAWRNIYLFPEHRRFRIKNTDVRFDVMDGPTHGVLRIHEEPVSTFTYDDIIARRLEYVHDGSESTEDSFDISATISSAHVTNSAGTFSLQPSYTVPIRIEPRNDPPQMVIGPAGQVLYAAPGTRVPLTASHLKVWDADSVTTEVWVEVRRMDGVQLVDKRGVSITRFTLAQLLNEKVYVAAESANGEVEFRAIDALNATSQTAVLKVSSVPVDIRMDLNTGIRLPHRASQTITSGNLSFTTNFPEVPLSYSIVDQPQSGIVECAVDGTEGFRLCAKFSQDDVSRTRVRYRHTSENKPKADSFSFQVHAGDATSGPHVLHIDFIPVSVHVFLQESLLLNNTEQAGIGRTNLLASTYPHNFPADELVYHVVEPPKFGMLSRRVEDGKKRRIGVSSNFTQQHVDDGSLTYTLHFVHYSVVSDFFVFRLVTPAAVSELVRFDITYIPGGNALQLLNRTLVVREGGTQQITNKSLWLETADDTNFVFTVAVPPFNGRFVLVSDVGAKFIPGLGGTFTSFDILSKRLFYEHSGDESRSDRAYLVAESIYRQNTRIPFWFTITIIAENDHPPEPCFRHEPARVHSEIHLANNGERAFHPSLLCWRDQDADNGYASLSYYFPVISKDFMISTKEAMEIPIGNFTQKDLDARRLVIRQLSAKREKTLRYAVSDGKYVVNASVSLVASDPFLRLLQSQLELPPGLEPGLVPISTRDLVADTSLDVDPSEIRFAVHPGSATPFRLLSNDGLLRPAASFYQRDIEDRHVFLLVEDPSLTTIPLSVEVADQVAEGTLSVVYTGASGISFRVEPQLRLAPSSVLSLNASVLRAQGSEAADAKFLLVQQPKHGAIVLHMPEVKRKSTRPSNNFVMGFRQSELDAGNLQYLHSGTLGTSTDSFVVNISIPTRGLLLGPMRFTIVIPDRPKLTLLVVKNLTLTVGSNASLDSSVLQLTDASNAKEYQFRVARQPSVGKIVSRRTMQPTDNFSRKQLNSGDILFVSDDNGLPAVSAMEVKACEGPHASAACSEPVSVWIRVEAENYAAPELIRNEPLFVVTSNHAVITEHHLKSLDPDTPSNELKFLVWQPIGGHVARLSKLNEPIQALSQRDIDERHVAFVLNGSSTGGFSFLVTDGVHQTPSEWFSVERASKMDIILERNSKLDVPPGNSAVITSEHLRAKALEVPPERLVYRITRAPLHGRIIRNGVAKAIDTFTQADLNDRLISYRSNTPELGSWSQRDHFNFAVSANGFPSNAFSKNKDENVFRFRVLVSFAHLTADLLASYVRQGTIHVGRGGSVALNSSHLDLSKLSEFADDQLLVEVVRAPKHGTLSLVHGTSETFGENSSSSDADEPFEEETDIDDEGVGEDKHSPSLRPLPSYQFHSGRHVLYKHVASADSDDELLLQVYALREGHRRARLEVRLSVAVLFDEESTTKVEKFRDELNVVSGGALTLDPSDFQTTDRRLSPSEIAYRVTQRGTNGVRLTLSDGSAAEAHSFTQAQINKGQVRLEHRPLSDDDKFDVVVLQVGTETRALVVRIEPLALHLFNHSDITYVQGKTYVVLNRAHLGASSNGDRSRIVYNVTKPPVNGTFYWVAGEKEANSFTQANIDDGDVLYAQLNMNAYQDYFEFTVGNEDNEMLKRSSNIIVLPAVEPQPLVIHANNVYEVGPAHLNASKLEGSVPRYLVVKPPAHGRLFLHPNANESAVFFTHSNILNGDLYFHAFEVEERTHEEIVLELRSDNVQPSRFKWLVEILPVDPRLGTVAPGLRPSTPGHDLDTSKGIRGSIGSPNAPNMAAPDMNYRFPLVILSVVVISVLIILLCRRNKSPKRDSNGGSGTAIPGIGHRELPPIDAAGDVGLGRIRNDLLDTTVYASIGRQQQHRRSTDDSDSDANNHRLAPSSRVPNHVAGSSRAAHASSQPGVLMAKPKPTFETFEGTPPVRVQPLSSGPTGPPAPSRAPHMYKATALAAVAAARMGTGSGGSAKLKDSQYWV